MKDVIWIPIFSMRSYETGQYAILKDGNFQLALARAIASEYPHVIIAVPENASDFEEVLEKYHNELGDEKISFLEMEYGMNAVETRDVFWQRNEFKMGALANECSLLVSDITGYEGPLPVIYNFNITKLPELDRPYIDRFWDKDIASIRQSLFTTVINPAQKAYIIEKYPELDDKVKVHLKVASEVLLPKPIVEPYPPKTIFWPFRISDKAYEWGQFLDKFIETKMHIFGWTIVVTDPNDTLKDPPSFVWKLKPTKEEYYAILSMKPIVVMLDDIDLVLHPGTIEIMHYGCPVITYNSILIDNPNSISNLDELVGALRDPVYNGVDTSRFVYKADEIDQYHRISNV